VKGTSRASQQLTTGILERPKLENLRSSHQSVTSALASAAIPLESVNAIYYVGFPNSPASIGHIYLIDVLPCDVSRNNRAVGNTVHSCTFREQWTCSSGLTREERKPYQVPVPPPTSIDIRYPLFLLLFNIYI